MWLGGREVVAGDQGVTEDVPQRFSNITSYQGAQYQEEKSRSAVSENKVLCEKFCAEKTGPT